MLWKQASLVEVGAAGPDKFRSLPLQARSDAITRAVAKSFEKVLPRGSAAWNVLNKLTAEVATEMLAEVGSSEGAASTHGAAGALAAAPKEATAAAAAAAASRQAPSAAAPQAAAKAAPAAAPMVAKAVAVAPAPRLEAAGVFAAASAAAPEATATTAAPAAPEAAKEAAAAEEPGDRHQATVDPVGAAVRALAAVSAVAGTGTVPPPPAPGFHDSSAFPELDVQASPFHAAHRSPPTHQPGLTIDALTRVRWQGPSDECSSHGSCRSSSASNAASRSVLQAATRETRQLSRRSKMPRAQSRRRRLRLT